MRTNRFTQISCVFNILLMAIGSLILSERPGTCQSPPQKGDSSKFSGWDKNGDGFLTRDEFPERFPSGLFDRIDADKDGKVSRTEDDAYRAANQSRRQQNQGRQRQNPPRQTPGAQQRENRNSNALDGAQIDRDIIYEKVGERSLPLDLDRPSGTDGVTPLVIWIHGGGWRGGSKKSPGPAAEMLKRGYAVASVEYRLSGEAIFPAAIEDCKAAVSFLRLNADKYNLDPKKFGVWGSSAGGHLVALLGTTNDVKLFDTHPVTKKASSAVQAVCDWFGPTDFLRMNDFKGSIDHDGANSPESLFIGGPIQANEAKSQRANPIHYVTASDPPMLLMHGDKDALVPYNQSELLYEALQKAGVKSTIYKVKNGGHGFRGADESREDLIDRSANFLDSVLK